MDLIDTYFYEGHSGIHNVMVYVLDTPYLTDMPNM